MKFLVVFLIVISFIFAPAVSAHLVGQPPFFKANGVFTNLYPVPTSSVADFELPQDIGAENYLVNQPIQFEMDLAVLPVLPEIVNQTQFIWDFGDGTRGNGLKNTHAYKKIGSYIMVVTAKYGNDQPQILQSTLLNIVPTKDYQLPQAVIEINGKQSKDPLLDIIELKFDQEITFDASKSVSPNGNLVEYYWDFGDGNFSNQKVTKHRYSNELFQVFPVLRVKDSQGFIADSYIEIKNINQINTFENVKQTVKEENNTTKIIVAIIIVLVIFTTAIILTRYRKKNRR